MSDQTGDATDKADELRREEDKIKEHAPEERSPNDPADQDDPNLSDEVPPASAQPRI